jgi:hypothetical protein
MATYKSLQRLFLYKVSGAIVGRARVLAADTVDAIGGPMQSKYGLGIGTMITAIPIYYFYRTSCCVTKFLPLAPLEV